MPNFPAIKISVTLFTKLRGRMHAGTITNLQIVLNTPKNPYLNQATPKTYLRKFSYQKKTLLSSLSLHIWSTPLVLEAAIILETFLYDL